MIVGVISVGVMTVGVLSVGVMTVGVLSVGVMTLSRVFKFSRPVQENSGGVLTVKLDYVLKGALVDIIPVLIMKNIIDTSSY